VNGGGHVAQIYAIRQAISKALVAYYQKCKYHINIDYPIVVEYVLRYYNDMVLLQMSMRRAKRR